MITSRKAILLIKSDGTTITLEKCPNLKEMQQLLGGYIEHVTVLDYIEHSFEGGIKLNIRLVYTSMYINEDGLALNLPRNEKATEIYQRNVRAQFPDSKTPFKDADDAMNADAKAKGFFIVDARPDDQKEEPYVVGDVIYFQGYTKQEANELFNATAA